MTTELASKVTLIPWDADSEVHREWLVKQRVECSWHQDKVQTKWKIQQQKGEKCIFWIVLPSDESQARADVGKEEKETLEDTATTIYAVPRQPTKERFVPIGHISLDAKDPESEKIDLDIPSEGVFWIKTFYVSQSVQGQGIGRAAMDEVEAMAVREPLSAKILMLDTVQKDDQKREEFAIATFGSVPKSTNEEWYTRRGYQVIKTVQNYYGVADRNGKVWDTKTVFMRKDIAGEQ
ncbi:uncharacterized protein N7529_008738 [Penicillium soppii]|uniref:uncharacterized protein n=1 Tax=Penicillium soppii TaxID=69789 RepID=UPI0025480331|nr:uncharacterized protein N7529_008738 [Penicillium soppii]KAJ5861428.1 hypothetical protein N7529_008738 [Penicillium soppii]